MRAFQVFNYFRQMVRIIHTRSILLLFTIISSLTVQAQLFSNYINRTSEWSIYCGRVDMNIEHREYYRFFINGDTTIGPLTYYKLQAQGIDSILPQNGQPMSVQPINAFAGALREDGHGKFYFIYATETTENL